MNQDVVKTISVSLAKLRLWPSCRETLNQVEFISSCVSLEVRKGAFGPLICLISLV